MDFRSNNFVMKCDRVGIRTKYHSMHEEEWDKKKKKEEERKILFV